MLRARTLLSYSALLFLISPSLTGNSVTKPAPKRPGPPASQVNPQRAAAVRKVDQWLKNSAGNLEQPEALAPFFERLYHAGVMALRDVHARHGHLLRPRAATGRSVR